MVAVKEEIAAACRWRQVEKQKRPTKRCAAPGTHIKKEKLKRQQKQQEAQIQMKDVYVTAYTDVCDLSIMCMSANFS